MKTYKETKQAVKELILTHGVEGVPGQYIVALYKDGHNGTNIQNAFNYFEFSPQAAKYRR